MQGTEFSTPGHVTLPVGRCDNGLRSWGGVEASVKPIFLGHERTEFPG